MTDAAAKQALFDKGLEKDLAYRGAKIREREIALAQAEARIQGVLEERNIFFASLVDDQDFSISDICRILHTKNWKTANDAVLAGRAARQALAPAPIVQLNAPEEEDGPFAWNEETGVLSVTFAAQDFAPHLAMLARHPNPAGEAWSFEYDGTRLLPTHAEDDTTWEQPVVQVIMTDAGKAQAIAYIESHRKAAA